MSSSSSSSSSLVSTPRVGSCGNVANMGEDDVQVEEGRIAWETKFVSAFIQELRIECSFSFGKRASYVTCT
jgi:hypothetical protein